MDNQTSGALTGAASGAAAGSAAGPYGAIAGAVLGGAMGFLGASDQKKLDTAAMFAEIAQSGARERDLINSLPDDLKPLYAQYKTALQDAGVGLQGNVSGIDQTLLQKTNDLYGPNSGAVQATLAGLKQQDYSTLPGTLTNLKAQLAATGGLARGGASKAITNAVLAPAAAYSQQSANVMGQQLTTQQNANQQAINKVAAMDENVAMQLFGMNKEQATQILTTGRQDLKDQMTSLVNQTAQETNQKLNVLGLEANANFQNATAKSGQNQAVVNGLINAGGQLAGKFGGGAGAGTGGTVGFDPSADSAPTGANADPSRYGINLGSSYNLA